MAFKL
jgi:GPI ethanolamine phosphate transferase 3 subunit O